MDLVETLCDPMATADGGGSFHLWTGMLCAAGICLGAATVSAFLNRLRSRSSKTKQQQGPKYWNPQTGRFVYSSTPLMFQPHTPGSIEDEKLEVAYVFQGSMVRISCGLRQLMGTYSSYFYHLYDTLNKDVVLMQQRILSDLQERFPPDQVTAIVAHLVSGQSAATISKEAATFFGVPSLLGLSKLYEDWLEEQSEALHFRPHPFLELDPLFDPSTAVSVVHTSHGLPAVSADPVRAKQRASAYASIKPDPADVASVDGMTGLVFESRLSLRDVAAIKHDYLACIQFKGQYAYLQRALTSWRTRSQFQRDAVAVNNLCLMWERGVAMHFNNSNNQQAKDDDAMRFESRRQLVHYEAIQFLLGTSSADLARLWRRWKNSGATGSGSGGRGLSIKMPDGWLGPPVLF